MASPGRVFESPAGRQRVVVRRSGAETGGAAFEVDFFLQAGGAVLAPHAHPAQEERFAVRAGVFRLSRGSEELTLRAGDSAAVPAGVRHRLANDGPGEAHAVVEFRPALRTEELFACLFAAAARSRGRASKWLAVSACLARYREEIRPASPILRMAARLAPVR